MCAQSLDVHFYNDPNDLFEQHPDVVLLSTSILSTEQHLSSEFDILCTHPIFGPESGKDSRGGLSFVYDKVRIGDESVRVDRCDKFLDIFKKEGCKMVEMSCAEHDRFAAGWQFVTHTMGRDIYRKKLFEDSEKERFVMQKLLGNGSPRPNEEEKEEVQNLRQSAGQERS
ncbi:hypothetical protein ACFE04_024988 [Oxalis oulophora]